MQNPESIKDFLLLICIKKEIINSLCQVLWPRESVIKHKMFGCKSNDTVCKILLKDSHKEYWTKQVTGDSKGWVEWDSQ